MKQFLMVAALLFAFGTTALAQNIQPGDSKTERTAKKAKHNVKQGYKHTRHNAKQGYKHTRHDVKTGYKNTKSDVKTGVDAAKDNKENR